MRILRDERWLIALLCLVGALRTFLYAAAFPFFSNGDEDLHFDVIVRYSDGRVPRSFDVLSSDALNFISLYASPEFIQTPDQFQDGRFPAPLWKQPLVGVPAWIAVGLIATIASISEIAVKHTVFASEHNWFHL